MQVNESGHKLQAVPKSPAEDTVRVKVDDKDHGTGLRSEELAVTHGLQCSFLSSLRFPGAFCRQPFDGVGVVYRPGGNYDLAKVHEGFLAK